MTRILLSATIVVCGLAAQEPPPHPYVAGVVLSTSGDPVRKARVILRAHDEAAFSYTSDSDANGRFVIQDVLPGVYSISADRQGFMPDQDGAPGAPAQNFKVEAGQSVNDLKIKLVPLAVITGRVLDDDGDPVRGARVEAMAYTYQTGKKQLKSLEQTSANDKGEFRLFGLHPGAIYIRGSSFSRGRFPPAMLATGSFTPTYFPNTTDAAHASPIDLAAGAQLSGIDIRLRRENHYSVRGKLPEVLKQEVSHRMLQIRPRDGSGGGSGLRQDEETFEFLDVRPGSYVITGDIVSNDKRSVVRQEVDVVNADVEGVTLNFVAPVSVSGSLRVEGVSPHPLEKMRVSLESDLQGQFGVEVKPDGSFAIPEIAPDAYKITIGAQPGTYVKSIRFGDEEASGGHIDLAKGSGPLTLVLATDVGEVEGSVKKTNGDPAVRVRVTLIASGNHLGRSDLSRYAFTDEQGKFHMRDVPPGEYKAFAWADAPFGAPQDPDFRKPFEKQALAVKLDPNGHATVDLTAISVKTPAP
jgi:Carboxypeptidase regulatory-like domain